MKQEKEFVGERIVVRENGTKDVQLICEKESLAMQSFKEECDINNVVRKYATTGQLPVLNKGEGKYGDFSAVTDYASALNAVCEAQEMFMQINAEIRERFDNDPAKFLAFVDDPKNGKELIKMGLAMPMPEKNDQSSAGGVKEPAKGAVFPTSSST